MVAVFKYQPSSPGLKELLNSDGVRGMLTVKAGSVLAAAQSTAPIESGAYKASLSIIQATTDRAVVRVGAGVDYALVVEARTGNLARSLDAAGGA